MNRQNPRRHRLSTAGFTLVELVIALALLAVVMTIAYGSLNGILRAKQALDDSRDVRAIGHALLLRLCRELQLASSIPLLPPKEDPKAHHPPKVFMLGDSQDLGIDRRGDTITFTALEGGQYLPDGGSHSGVVQITYRVARNPDSNLSGEDETFYLVREETPKISPVEDAYEKTMIFPLTKDLVSLEFKYFNKETEEWLDTWGKAPNDGLPAIVMFTLKLRSARGAVRTLSTSVPIRAAG